MTTYIDPTTELPQLLGDIYGDRNIRIVGRARINPLITNQVEIDGLQVLCTPAAGGAEGVSNVTGPCNLSGAGSSAWAKITRSGTATVTPEIYAAGTQPKSRKDYVQLFYQTSSSQIVSVSSFLIYPGPLYTRLGYGVGQRVYDAIVGNSGDDHVTHEDLQTAINDTPTNGWILIKKMCVITSTLTTGGKSIKFVFEGYGTGIQAGVPNPGTGITFGAAGCQLVGFGQCIGFTTYAVNLNNLVGARIEMVFSGNTANINFGTLTGLQYNIQGSYGLTENSHIQGSTTDGAVARWNDPAKRWDPVPSITINGVGKITSAGDVQTTSTLETTGPTVGSIVTAGGVGVGKAVQVGSTTASTNTTTGSIVTAGGVGIAGAVNVGGNITASSGTITGNIVIGAVYNP